MSHTSVAAVAFISYILCFAAMGFLTDIARLISLFLHNEPLVLDLNVTAALTLVGAVLGGIVAGLEIYENWGGETTDDEGDDN